MASTIAQAQRKYAEKIPTMKANYVTGVARFLGVSAAQISGSAAVSKYNSNLPTDGSKWAAGVRAGFGVG